MIIFVETDWQSPLPCAGKTAVMYREDVQGVALAKSICSRCRLPERCLAMALANDEQHGTWGG